MQWNCLKKNVYRTDLVGNMIVSDVDLYILFGEEQQNGMSFDRLNVGQVNLVSGEIQIKNATGNGSKKNTVHTVSVK